VVGNIGRMIPQKNQLFLIDAFAELKKREPKAKLLLIGDGELRKDIDQKIAELGLEDSVRIEKRREDANKCYSVMDVFAFPSIYEGLGMVAIEAQVAGVRVVASEYVPLEADMGLFQYRPLDVRKFLSGRADTKKKAYEISEQAPVLKNYYEKELCRE
jgi:glycosyltransferase EpsF